MGILGKFNSFNVKSTDRISAEDNEFLQHHEKMYKQALAVYKRVYAVYKEEYEKYTEDVLEQYKYSDFLVKDFGVPKRVDAVQSEYVSKIYSYFESKYKVSLENRVFKGSNLEREYYRYNDKEEVKDLVVPEIDYNTVIDDIIDQLGGLSFADRAIKEIKDALKDKCYNKYRDEWYIKIKGNTITYNGYGYVDQRWGGEYEVHSRDVVRPFLKALSFERYGKDCQIYGLSKLYNYSIYLNEDELKDGLNPIDVPVEKIKFFKNGRIDIKFKEAEQARKFAREWCGYTLV